MAHDCSRKRVSASTIICSSLALVLAVSRPGLLHAQVIVDEDGYVQRVLTTSIEAREAERSADLGRAPAVGAGTWPNPTFQWERQENTSGSRDGETQDILFLSIPLVLSGRLGLVAAAADERARAADARLVHARAELRRTAMQGFTRALTTRKRREILEASLRELDDLVAIVDAREAAGDAAGYERMRIGLQQATVRDTLEQARQEERVALGEAMHLLGANEQPIALEGPLAPVRALPDADGLLATLEARRADLRALELEVNAAELARRAATRGRLPDPVVRGGVQLLDAGQSGSGTGYVVGLGVPLPLFQRRQGEEARAVAQRALAETRRARLLHTAEAQLSTALEVVPELRTRLERHRSGVLPNALDLKRSALAAYEGGAADLLVLVDAEHAGREAQLKEVDLARAVVEAETRLLLLAGSLDEEAPE